MHQSPVHFPPDYYRVSPVRGQLEAYDPSSPRNWRYIQTTDTPNELRVLLPPAVSSQYEQLLKLELAELAKRPSKMSAPLPHTPSQTHRAGESFVFQSLIAPEDFRLKEMENWFQLEARSAKSIPAPVPLKSKPVVVQRPLNPIVARNTCCARCSRSTEPATVLPMPVPSPGQHASSKGAHPADHPPSWHAAKRSPSPDHSHAPEQTPHVPEQSHVEEVEDAIELSRPLDAPYRSRSPSPDPLPYRAPSPEVAALTPIPEEESESPFPPTESPPPDSPKHDAEQNESGSSSDSSTIAPTPPASPPPLPHLLRISDPSLLKDLTETDAISAPNPTPVPIEPLPPVKPALARRRSCIKRSSGDSVKTVSWADDRDISDQIAKIAFFTTEPRVDEPEEDDDAMSGIDSLHLELKKSLEEAQADPSHFELVESLIAEHKEKIRHGIHDTHHLRTSILLEKVLEVDDEDSKLSDSEDEDI
ncbi:hypothetical protein BDZ89DRAFT_1109138 [Hymenopellis radicata]|nr:hypothetical protein BDZ89DRAFT_1109138 [Hymenopellis radicata]